MRTQEPKEKICHFCLNGINEVDYKDLKVLQKFLSPYMKIMSRDRTGTCAKHQRKLTKAIKRARYLSLIPFSVK